MNPISESLLAEIVQRLVTGLRPDAIILFGSHVWGTPDEDSDLDLLVVVADGEVRPAEQAARAYRCLRDLLVPIDILVKTRAEVERFRQVHASLESEILERGKVLYARGQAAVGAKLAGEGAA